MPFILEPDNFYNKVINIKLVKVKPTKSFFNEKGNRKTDKK